MVYRFGLIFALLALCACTPESRNTLPDDYRIALDERLLGTWRPESDGDDFRIQVSERGPREFAARTSESVTTESGGTRIRFVEYRLQEFDVEGRRILAIQELVQTPGREASWLFATYHVSQRDDTTSVSLFLMDETHVRRLVQSGQLGGTIRGAETQFPEVFITAPPEALDDLIRNTEPSRLFTLRAGPFARVTN